MLYLAYAFNTLVLVALVLELHQARKERQQLALLIKSRDVEEFVRADLQLNSRPEPEEPKDPTQDLDDADPVAVAAALAGKPPAA